MRPIIDSCLEKRSSKTQSNLTILLRPRTLIVATEMVFEISANGGEDCSGAKLRDEIGGGVKGEICKGALSGICPAGKF